jgi:hypothetical protein
MEILPREAVGKSSESHAAAGTRHATLHVRIGERLLRKKAPGGKRHDNQIDWHPFHRFVTELNLDLGSTIPVAALDEHRQRIAPKRCVGYWALGFVFLAIRDLVSQNDSVAMVAFKLDSAMSPMAVCPSLPVGLGR